MTQQRQPQPEKAPHRIILGDREYVTFVGLLDAAHTLHVQHIATEIVQLPHEANQQVAVFKAVVTMPDGRTFTGHGDASPENAKRVAASFLRMAETRSIARALRLATNRGETAYEELPEADDPLDGVPTRATARQQASASSGPADPVKSTTETTAAPYPKAQRPTDNEILPETHEWWIGRGDRPGLRRRIDTAENLGVDVKQLAMQNQIGMPLEPGYMGAGDMAKLGALLVQEIRKREPKETPKETA